MTTLHFLGAADTVTGSRHLIDTGDARVLLDCGMFQGYKAHRERNWDAPGPEYDGLDAVVLSHAHLDHRGWLPVLVRAGFRGPILCSRPTADLLEVMLTDSARLQEQEARRANRHGYSRHEVARPLYTVRDVQRTLRQLKPVAFNAPQQITGRTRVLLQPAGHLLGAAMVQVQVQAGGVTVGFSGDLGRADDLLMPPPERMAHADVLLVESTYGNRLHAPEDAEGLLGDLITRTAARGGSVLMPTFAVGRAQALMVLLARLLRAGRIPRLPIYLDSPMANQASEAYLRHARGLRVSARELREAFSHVRAVSDASQSARLVNQRMPRIVLAASGMATGGRVLFHLQAMAPDLRHSIVFPGYQVGGTRGARLVAGERDIKMFGGYVPVRAEVRQIEGFSGHADRDGVLAWLGGFSSPPGQTFVVHGEPGAADALRCATQDRVGWPAVHVPAHGAQVTL